MNVLHTYDLTPTYKAKQQIREGFDTLSAWLGVFHSPFLNPKLLNANLSQSECNLIGWPSYTSPHEGANSMGMNK